MFISKTRHSKDNLNPNNFKKKLLQSEGKNLFLFGIHFENKIFSEIMEHWCCIWSFRVYNALFQYSRIAKMFKFSKIRNQKTKQNSVFREFSEENQPLKASLSLCELSSRLDLGILSESRVPNRCFILSFSRYSMIALVSSIPCL